MDFRLSCFYRSHRFSQYNMVNGFFFSQKDEENFHHFIKDNVKPSDKCLIFCDPPFSAPLGLIIEQIRILSIAVIQHTLSSSTTQVNSENGDENNVPYFLVLPFFFEKKLQKIAPFLNLLDYKITYESHSRLDFDSNDIGDQRDSNSKSGSSSHRGQRRDSVVRLFTSLRPSLVHPPKSMEKSFRSFVLHGYNDNNIRLFSIIEFLSNTINLMIMLTNIYGSYYFKYFLIGLIIFFIIIFYHNHFTSLHNMTIISNEQLNQHIHQSYYYKLPSYINQQCTYSTCFNISKCVHEVVDKSLHTIRVYVYPLKEDSNSMLTNFSQQFISLYNAILSSKYYVNRIEEACIIVPIVDLLYPYPDDSQMIDLSMRYLNHLPSWNEGKNHLLINFLFNEKLQYSASAIIASASHTSDTFRTKFDIVLPAFNPFTVVVDHSIHERRTIFLTVFQSTDQNFIKQLHYLLLDSPRTLDSNLSSTIIVLDYSILSNVTYMERFAIVSESQYRQSVKKWINYSESLCSSEFCLIIDADNLNRFNLYDSLAYGCIPVIVNDDIVLPFSEVLDWHKIVIRVPRVKFQKIPSILSTYSLNEKLLLRQQIRFIYQRYFSSIEKIMLTTLDILNDRVFPQYSRSYAEWNYPDYSKIGFPISPALFYPAKAFPRVGFTALIRAHNHFTLLCTLLRSIQSVISLRQIVVVWTNKIYPVPDSALWPSLTVPLHIVRSAYGSVNGRYFPYRRIKTEAIFSIEEDVCLPSVESIERAFELWCQNPERLVTLSDRSIWHFYDGNQSFSASFSSVFFHKHYLHLYTDLLANPIKAFIDDLEACEDIFLYWFIIQTSYGQSYHHSSNQYNVTNQCNSIPRHCSRHVNRLKSFVKQFNRSNYYPMKIASITAGAL
ncbi:Exostosin-2 [Schistosoma japonicum]|uniref:Exostosin-2 n=1 Tax=Schistosoma japonicum TaxID=6182 RepID=A0A4Z2CTJ6_SCHJA|nr:Exostosin-2 [Schistosoma japonicum]TNN07424.1 Exostosin-2 [Schistosoma japonicum]